MTAALWFIWFLASLAATARQAKWQFDYFAHPGPTFHLALAIGIPALLVFTAAYAWLRTRGLWKYEPHILAALVALTLAVYEPRAFLVSVLVFAACYAAGRFTLARAGLAGGAPLEDIAISCGIGFAWLMLAMFALGLARLFYWPVIAALLILTPALLWRHLRGLVDSVRAIDASWRCSPELRSPVIGLCVVFAAVSLVFSCMVVLAPSLAFDVLYMHLPSAFYYQAHHALLPVPGLGYSLFPQGVELLMTAGTLLAGQAGAQMLPPILFLLTALLLIQTVRLCGGSAAGALCGAVFAVTLPFLHWSGSVPKNDLALAFFELAALYCYLRWRENGRFRWIQLGVFFLAAAFNIKDVVAFGAIPLAALFLYAAWREPQRRRAFVSIALVFLAFGTYSHVRTLLLDPHALLPTPVAHSVTRATVGGPSAMQKIGRYLAVPWLVHFEGTRAFESLLPNPMGVFLLSFVPLWFFRLKKTSPLERACLLFIGLYLASWGLFWGLVRYAIAPIGLLCALTGERVMRFFERGGNAVRAGVQAACVYTMVFALTATAIIELNGPQLLYFAGRLDKPDYLRNALITYPSLEFLKSVARPGDSIASVGNCSSAYAPAGVQFDSWCRTKDMVELNAPRLKCMRVRFIVLPNNANGAALESILRANRPVNRVYEDRQFAVYSVQSCPAR